MKKYFITSASTQCASLREREGNTLTTSRESASLLALVTNPILCPIEVVWNTAIFKCHRVDNLILQPNCRYRLSDMHDLKFARTSRKPYQRRARSLAHHWRAHTGLQLLRVARGWGATMRLGVWVVLQHFGIIHSDHDGDEFIQILRGKPLHKSHLLFEVLKSGCL